jgi:hypothetical protein
MTRFGRVGGVFRQATLGGLILALGLVVSLSARATDLSTEQRDFTIYVDGDRAGNYSMSITQRDDGSETMSASANVRVKYLAGLKVYTYTYRGTETWKDGRLVNFSCSGSDDGKDFAVSAMPEGDGLRLRANNQVRIVRPDIWLTTYWHLADPIFRNKGVPLVDADTGLDLAVQLRYVETRQMKVAGEVQNCTHYKVSGETQAELWYDSQERLIRLTSWSDGHRYELVLSRIRR